MTEEQKRLLIKDLCGRLPYGVKALFPDLHGGYTSAIEDIDIDGYIKDFEGCQYEIVECKPYLFPLSSMAEEQKTFFEKKSIELDKYGDISTKEDNYGSPFYADLSDYLEVIDWLNAHHFDYRGLIEQGLAIDATGIITYNKEETP